MCCGVLRVAERIRAAVIWITVTRLIPGRLGERGWPRRGKRQEVVSADSEVKRRLGGVGVAAFHLRVRVVVDYPHYTRPAEPFEDAGCLRLWFWQP